VRSGRGRHIGSDSPYLSASIDHIEDVAPMEEGMFELRLSPSPAPSPAPTQPANAHVGTATEAMYRRAAERMGRTLRIFAFGRCSTYKPASQSTATLSPITLVEVFGNYTLRTPEALPSGYLRLCNAVTGITSLALAVLLGAGRIRPESASQELLAEANALAAELSEESRARRAVSEYHASAAATAGSKGPTDRPSKPAPRWG
jgi:hypothetical protein